MKILWRQAFRQYRLVIYFALFYFLINIVIHFINGHPLGLSFIPYFKLFVIAVIPVTAIIALPLQIFYRVLKDKPKHPIFHLAHYYKTTLFNPARWVNIALASFVMMLSFSSYTGIKALIPLMADYKLDTLFMKWDWALHGNRNPWLWLQPIFKNSFLIQALDKIYVLWFVLMFGFWSTAALNLKGDHWRHQFMLSFVLMWMIGGNLLAYLLYSMGPTYYDLVPTIKNPYLSQMEILSRWHEKYGLLNIENQAILRSQYLTPQPGGLGGISAMPSLHNATSMLFVFAGFRIHKLLGYVLVVFLLSILIGSVLFGWHYAIDGYFGILLAIVIWKISGYAISISERQSSSLSRS